MKLNYKIKKIIWFILIFLNIGSLVFAGTVKKQNFFTNFGAGARAHVLKFGYVSIADDYTAVFWNPAAMAFTHNIAIGASHANLSFDRQIGAVGLIFPVHRNHKIGLSWQGFIINSIPARSSNTAEADGYFSNVEQTFGLAYSLKIFSFLGLGANLNYFHQSLDQSFAHGFGWNAGAIVRPFSKLKLGLVFYDLQGYLNWETGHRDFFEKKGRLGVSYQLTRNALFSIGMDNQRQFSFAAEISVLEPFSLRTGIENKFLALGMGWRFSINNLNVHFNYAVSNDRINHDLNQIMEIQFAVGRRSRLKSDWVKIRVSYLNVRQGPGMKYRVIGWVRKGQVFKVKAKRSGWYRIQIKKGKTGWIQGYYVESIR